MVIRILAVLAASVAFGCQTQAVDLHCKTQSFRQQIDGYDLVLFGTLERPKEGDDPEWTDFRITQPLRTHDSIKGMDVIRVPRKIPQPGPKDPSGYLLLGAVRDGKPDFVSGGHATVALVDYFKGILAIDAKDRVKTLRFAFDYLEHEERLISTEAFREFEEDTDDIVRTAAKGSKPEKLRKWLEGEHTWNERGALYACLLSGCGAAGDAMLIRDTITRLSSKGHWNHTDRMMIAYTILDPKAGWKFIGELIADTAGEFPARYSGLKAVRYFRVHPGVIAEKDILAALETILAQPDMADLPIDELRRWKRWELNDQIFALIDKEDFQKKFIRRSILRYALQCPDARAAKYIAEQRAVDPEGVAENEKWLAKESVAKK